MHRSTVISVKCLRLKERNLEVIIMEINSKKVKDKFINGLMRQ